MHSYVCCYWFTGKQWNNHGDFSYYRWKRGPFRDLGSDPIKASWNVEPKSWAYMAGDCGSKMWNLHVWWMNDAWCVYPCFWLNLYRSFVRFRLSFWSMKHRYLSHYLCHIRRQGDQPAPREIWRPGGRGKLWAVRGTSALKVDGWWWMIGSRDYPMGS